MSRRHGPATRRAGDESREPLKPYKQEDYDRRRPMVEFHRTLPKAAGPGLS